MRWLLLAVLAAGLVGCGGDDLPADHGGDVPGRARQVLDCPGRPGMQGSGNYDTGPETVGDDAQEAMDSWLAEEGGVLPDVPLEETAREGRAVLFTWTEGSTLLGSFVVHEGIEDLEGHRGWGVYSWAVCDPSYWPDDLAVATGHEVWSNADGDRVDTAFVVSFPGAEHCGWQDSTFLQLGSDGQDGTFVGRPTPELRSLLATTYAEHTGLPGSATDTGYQRDGRELWVTGTAAYLVGADGDAERWPAATKPIGCA